MSDRDALLKEIDEAVAEYRRVFREPYSLAPNLDLACRAAAMIRELSPDPECLCYGAGIAWNCRADE